MGKDWTRLVQFGFWYKDWSARPVADQPAPEQQTQAPPTNGSGEANGAAQ